MSKHRWGHNGDFLGYTIYTHTYIIYIYIRIAAGSPIWTEVRLSPGGTVDACEILHRKDGWKPKVFDHSFHWNLLKSASLWSMFNFSPRRKGTERLDNAFLGDAEEGHGQCRQWKGSEWKGNMSSQDVRTADGHFSNLFGFDFVYQRVATRLKGCRIFALSLVMVEGGRTTAGNPRGCNITVLKPWCSGRSYVFFSERDLAWQSKLKFQQVNMFGKSELFAKNWMTCSKSHYLLQHFRQFDLLGEFHFFLNCHGIPLGCPFAPIPGWSLWSQESWVTGRYTWWCCWSFRQCCLDTDSAESRGEKSYLGKSWNGISFVLGNTINS